MNNSTTTNNTNNTSSKMQIRENFSVDGATREPRGFFVTRMALLTTVGIFSCLLIGTGLLIYQLAGCPDEGPVQASICDHHHFHHTFDASNLSRLLPHDTTSTAPTTSTSSTMTMTMMMMVVKMTMMLRKIVPPLRLESTSNWSWRVSSFTCLR